MYCRADRHIHRRNVVSIASTSIVVLLLMSLLGQYAADAFSSFSAVTSSAVRGSSQDSSSIAGSPTAHLLHQGLTWAVSVGFAILMGLMFGLATQSPYDALMSLPPPNRPPIV